MKKCLFFTLTVLFLFSALTDAVPTALANSASSYCVIDALTGRILYEKNAHTKRGMASTTKIMTAVVALEKAVPESVATTSYNASRTEGSSLYLKAGEKMRVIDLVYGLLLNSGNDAAVVLAEHIGGSVEGFCEIMNEFATKIGATSTHFTNPNGLYDDNHYTTAYDLALITRYAMKNDEFKRIAATKKHTIETVDTQRKIYLSNHNKLLSSLDGCDGVKTGFTKKTGRCLVSSVSRNGWQAICVTLNAPDDWRDHTALMEQAFSEYQLQKIISKGQLIKTIPISDGQKDSIGALVGEDVFLPAKAGENVDFKILYNTKNILPSPVIQGQSVGSIDIVYNKNVFSQIELVASETVDITKKASYFEKLVTILKYVI